MTLHLICNIVTITLFIGMVGWIGFTLGRNWKRICDILLIGDGE